MRIIDESDPGVETTPVRPPPIEKLAPIAGPIIVNTPAPPDVARKKPSRGPRHIPPKDRGGRRRPPDEELPTYIPQPVAEGIPQPEITCRLDDRGWAVMVELPKDLVDRPNLRVTQDRVNLPLAKRWSDCWLLRSATAGIVVSWTQDGESDDAIMLLDKDECLLFRLVGPEMGRLVDYPIKGPYLAIVPDGWERDEERSGVEPVDPEGTSLDGFTAHYFDIDDICRVIAFRSGGDRPSIERRRSEFHLVGNCIEDACERIGPLFGRELPLIHTNHASDWANIAQIVVIEETERWRMNFEPHAEGADMHLPEEIADLKVGWFSLRLYDADDILVESLDFRYVSTLVEVVSDSFGIPAPESGHETALPDLFHDPDFAIEAEATDGAVRSVSVNDTCTRLVIPPDSRYDRTRWLIGTRDCARRVPFELVIDRVWWAVGEEGANPSEWQATPACLTREIFSPTSRTAVWIRLPRRRWANEVYVGFRGTQTRRYGIRVDADSLAVPFREFTDGRVLNEPGDHHFDVSLRHMGKEWKSTAGILKVACYCRKCGHMSTSRDEMREHLAHEHLTDAFRSLTYDETRQKYAPELPSEIYKCTVEGCPDYVESDGLKTRTTLMAEHCRKKHNRDLDGLRIVTNDDEKRQVVRHALPHIFRCLLCRNGVVDIEEPDGSSARRTAHFSGHMQELTEFR